MPPDLPGWKTFEEANERLLELGWGDPTFMSNFTPSELFEAVTTQLREKSTRLLDASDSIPKGANGSHARFLQLSTSIDKESRESPNTVFFIFRTRENTPAFLGGGKHRV